MTAFRAPRLERRAPPESLAAWNQRRLRRDQGVRFGIVVVRGTFVYVILYSSLEKLTSDDRALFDAVLSTVDLP